MPSTYVIDVALLRQRHIGDKHFTPEIDHEANEMLRLLIEQMAQA